MKNFEITAKEDGKKYWISRASTICAIVFSIQKDELCILANKRGEGVPDEKHKWNLICGYVDWDERIEDAAKREIKEETGITDFNKFMFIGYNDDLDAKQNIGFRFVGTCPNDTKFGDIKSLKGGEKNEVEEIKWIPVKEYKQYDWAFSHKDIIAHVIKHIKSKHDGKKNK